MRVIVVPIDRFISRDGEAVKLPEWPFDDGAIHAIQWYGEYGEVEYTGRPKPPNEQIDDPTILQPYLEALDDYLAQSAAE
jgi:hypothetical protein